MFYLVFLSFFFFETQSCQTCIRLITKADYSSLMGALPCHSDGTKWQSPGTSVEVKDWITAPIDYCSCHCPSEMTGQEMHPPPCRLLGGTALQCRRQWDLLSANHCCLLVTKTRWPLLGWGFIYDLLNSHFQEVHYNYGYFELVSAVWLTQYLLGVILLVMLFTFHKD